jgi:hypothetical protein
VNKTGLTILEYVPNGNKEFPFGEVRMIEKHKK